MVGDKDRDPWRLWASVGLLGRFGNPPIDTTAVRPYLLENPPPPAAGGHFSYRVWYLLRWYPVLSTHSPLPGTQEGVPYGYPSPGTQLGMVPRYSVLTMSIPQSIEAILREAPNPVPFSALKGALPGVPTQTLKNTLGRMTKAGRIGRGTDGYQLGTKGIMGTGTHGTHGTGTQEPVLTVPMGTGTHGTHGTGTHEVVPTVLTGTGTQELVLIPEVVPAESVPLSAYVRTPGVKQTPTGYVIEGKPLPEGCFVHPETIGVVEIPPLPTDAEADFRIHDSNLLRKLPEDSVPCDREPVELLIAGRYGASWSRVAVRRDRTLVVSGEGIVASCYSKCVNVAIKR